MEKEIEFEAMLPRDKVIDYLQDFIKSYKEGKIFVQSGERTVELKPEDQVKVEAEAKQSESKGKFSLKLSWKKVAEERDQPELKICAKAPAPKAEDDRPVVKKAIQQPAQSAGVPQFKSAKPKSA